MKKSIVLFSFFLVALASNAQRPVLVGATLYGGANNDGTVISYIGGDTSLNGLLNSPSSPNTPINATLTEAPNGKFYGLVNYGGTSGGGYVYEYDYTANTYTIVANLSVSTGYEPWGSLLLADNGLLYGLTYLGGANNGGTLFSYATGSDSVIVLVNFPWSVGSRGSLIQASNGKLYGMNRSSGGMGSIFQYDIGTAIDTVLYNFSSIAEPSGNLIEVGADTFYGLTPDGNTIVNCGACANYGGTLFRYIAASGTYTDLHNFDSLDNPTGSLTLASDGNLYGTAHPVTGGVLFKYSIADSTYTIVASIGNTYGGDVVQASDSMLYGITSLGGNYGNGSIFRYDIATSAYTLEVSLDSATGDRPGYGHLTEYVPAAVIQHNPTDQYACAGSAASFTSSASGRSVTIQWQVSSDGGSAYADIPGASDSIYTFIVSAADSGLLYRAVFTNVMVVDTSSSAMLTILQPDTLSQTRTITLGQYLLVGTDTLSVGGTYIDTLLGSHGCDSIVTTHLTVIDGIVVIENYYFSLSPNPTNTSFTITNNYSGTLSVNIITLLGERLKTYTMSGSQQSFDISDLASGIYEVQISDEGQTLNVMKVVKE